MRQWTNIVISAFDSDGTVSRQKPSSGVPPIAVFLARTEGGKRYFPRLEGASIDSKLVVARLQEDGFCTWEASSLAQQQPYQTKTPITNQTQVITTGVFYDYNFGVTTHPVRDKF